MRVLIADGSALIRERLAESFKDSKDITIVGQARNAVETITEVWKSNPDAVVMDILMPAGGAVEVLQSIRKYKPSTHVIVLSSSDEPVFREKCIAMGAVAFLDKATEFYRVADILNELTP